MERRFAWLRGPLGGLGFVMLAACSDFATDPGDAPAAILFNESVVTVTENDGVALTASVVDRKGRPIENIPRWSPLAWASSDPLIVRADGAGLTALRPGEVRVTAAIADVEGSAIVRVNPTRTKLDIGAIVLGQPGQPPSVIAPGVATTLHVYLTASGINYFRPEVVATLVVGGMPTLTLNLERDGVSIPRGLDITDPSNAWRGTIPAEFVQPGLELVVEADPGHAFDHDEGSRDRYPTHGSFALAIGRQATLLRMEAATLTQSIQRLDGTVPLVQGRDALLRVFVTADEANDYAPIVQASFYEGDELIHRAEITRSDPEIPRRVRQETLEGSWNVMIPGDVLRPGISMVVEVDPVQMIPLKPGSHRRIPATGRLPLDVRVVPPLWVRMVPVTQATQGTTGDISPARVPHFIEAVRSRYPLLDVHMDIRAPYVTSRLASSQQGWADLLFELRALRLTDNSNRYYYGVLTHPGGNNIGGVGFIGGSTAIGYDHPARAHEVFAHEIGHNFNLRHAPCGGPVDVDPFFPYGGASIGQYGFNTTTGMIKIPSTDKDLMSYCGPEWISDYNFERVLLHRELNDWTNIGPYERRDALLVWGGVSNGRLVLEPSFRFEMRASLPSGVGDYEVRGLDTEGRTVFSYRFEPEEADHFDARGFAFSIPDVVARMDDLAEIVVSGPEGEARRSRSMLAPAPAARTGRPGIDGMEAAWDTTRSPVALVADARTGEVISFSREGRIAAPGRVIDVITSDGVRSTRRTIDLR